MAADNGAKVINISYYANDYSQLDSAAAYARSKGALTFVAAGNTDGFRNIADYSNLIFVSGTDENDQRWSQWKTEVTADFRQFLWLVRRHFRPGQQHTPGRSNHDSRIWLEQRNQFCRAFSRRGCGFGLVD